jgi:hypothetical protein
MKVNTSLSKGKCKPTERTRLTQWFLSRRSLGCHQVSPCCVNRTLGGSWIIGITHQAHTLGAARTYPQVRVAQWHTLLVLLFATPARWARYPSQILLWSTIQSSCMLHDEELTTKPSRRWQPPRIISTTSLQLDHLVSLLQSLNAVH